MLGELEGQQLPCLVEVELCVSPGPGGDRRTLTPREAGLEQGTVILQTPAVLVPVAHRMLPPAPFWRAGQYVERRCASNSWRVLGRVLCSWLPALASHGCLCPPDRAPRVLLYQMASQHLLGSCC